MGSTRFESTMRRGGSRGCERRNGLAPRPKDAMPRREHYRRFFRRPPAEAFARVDEHLAECQRCRDVLDEYAPLAGSLKPYSMRRRACIDMLNEVIFPGLETLGIDTTLSRAWLKATATR
jgi:hypothetical protein